MGFAPEIRHEDWTEQAKRHRIAKVPARSTPIFEGCEALSINVRGRALEELAGTLRVNNNTWLSQQVHTVRKLSLGNSAILVGGYFGPPTS